MDVWHKLFDLDKKLQLVTKRWFILDDQKRFHKAFLAGSSVETGMICRSLRTKIFEMEYDIMMVYGELNEEMGAQFLNKVEDKPGYYYLSPSPTAEYLSASVLDVSKMSDQGREEYKSFLQIFMDTSSPRVNTSKMKELLESFQRANDPHHIHASINDGPSAAAEILLIDNLRLSLQSSPLLYSFVVKCSSIRSFDDVFCIVLTYLPDSIVPWMTAEDSKWPSTETRRKIIGKGFHIVTKNIDGLFDTWRLSTSAAESILFGAVTDLQKLTYLMIKALFYHHLKDISCSWIASDGKMRTLPSYLIKTIFLHYLRNKPNVWWSRVDVIIMTLCEVFKELLQSLVIRKCHSFLVEHQEIFNFEQIPNGVMENIINVCEIIAENPSYFLPNVSEIDLNCFSAIIDCVNLHLERRELGQDACSDEALKSCETSLLSRLKLEKPIVPSESLNYFVHFIQAFNDYDLYIIYKYGRIYEIGEKELLNQTRQEMCLNILTQMFKGEPFSPPTLAAKLIQMRLRLQADELCCCRKCLKLLKDKNKQYETVETFRKELLSPTFNDV